MSSRAGRPPQRARTQRPGSDPGTVTASQLALDLGDAVPMLRKWEDLKQRDELVDRRGQAWVVVAVGPARRIPGMICADLERPEVNGPEDERTVFGRVGVEVGVLS